VTLLVMGGATLGLVHLLLLLLLLVLKLGLASLLVGALLLLLLVGPHGPTLLLVPLLPAQLAGQGVYLLCQCSNASLFLLLLLTCVLCCKRCRGLKVGHLLTGHERSLGIFQGEAHACANHVLDLVLKSGVVCTCPEDPNSNMLWVHDEVQLCQLLDYAPGPGDQVTHSLIFPEGQVLKIPQQLDLVVVRPSMPVHLQSLQGVVHSLTRLHYGVEILTDAANEHG
jgi:hypothetical protein